jgi:hypothetical protein
MTQQHIFCVHYFILSEDLNTTKKTTVYLLVAAKDTGKEVNTEKVNK